MTTAEMPEENSINHRSTGFTRRAQASIEKSGRPETDDKTANAEMLEVEESKSVCFTGGKHLEHQTHEQTSTCRTRRSQGAFQFFNTDSGTNFRFQTRRPLQSRDWRGRHLFVWCLPGPRPGGCGHCVGGEDSVAYSVRDKSAGRSRALIAFEESPDSIGQGGG